jgi:hypothetical protein
VNTQADTSPGNGAGAQRLPGWCDPTPAPCGVFDRQPMLEAAPAFASRRAAAVKNGILAGMS